MKKILGFLFLLAVSAFANTPAVTISLTATTAKFNFYTVTFTTSTDSAAVDSAYIYQTGTTPFNIESIGYLDSLITVQLTSTEETADSIRFNILYEVSPLISPTTTQYSTAYRDSAAFTNHKPGDISRFHIRSRAGLNRTMRLLFVENNALKSISQTITLRIIIPKQ